MSLQMDASDLRRRLDAAPMSPAQTIVVAITVALSALDGYDVLSITFAAPAIARELALGKAALGLLLSAGLAGMALGSLVLAPFADIVGRRRLVIASLGLMAGGMLLCSVANSLAALAVWRTVTGLGIGAMVAVINPIAAEIANERRRAMALALMAMGYPLGGLLGGLLAAILLREYGWRAVFGAGAVAAALLIPIVLWFLLEPLTHLLSRRGPGALRKVNAFLSACRQAPIDSLPDLGGRPPARYSALFTPGQRSITVRITAANLLYVMTVYYVLSWLPQIVTEAGFSASAASLIAAIANFVGIIGGVVLGALARRLGLQRVTTMMMVGLGLSAALLGIIPASMVLFLAAAGVCGFFLFGGIAGLYATLAASFADDFRATGSGFVIGIGRVGSAVAPSVAGWLFAFGLSLSAVSIAFGALALIGGACLARGPRQSLSPALPVGQGA